MKLADGSIVSGTGFGDRVLKFLPDGTGLDPAFSTAPLPERSLSVAVDPAGRLLVLGSNLYRLTPQGVVDSTFVYSQASPSGEPAIPVFISDPPRRIAVQKDGRVIVSNGVAAARFWN